MKKQTNNFFKLGGSYLGLFLGFIASLQLKIIRLFFYGDLQESNCLWSPFKNLSCYNLVLFLIMIFLISGFILGGITHKKILSEREKIYK